ncbi:hypothetical protein QQS21_007200 [Conoideocrella luteorostrata]|uniref:Uncharacterized protein n=1 Tax=Conoideocrella luteorostrata TaxID=1105319 RepID=A0AAJ0CNW3_9HYPO|nr:hypothetical protein QQS21_007200 [Conoideocrella luteorostrata]
MSITPSQVTWFSSTPASDIETATKPDHHINDNHDELAKIVHDIAQTSKKSPILVTVIDSGATDSHLTVECKDRERNYNTDHTTVLSQAANVIRQLSTDPKKGEYSLEYRSAKYALKFEPCGLINTLVSAIRRSGHDYVIVHAPEKARGFLHDAFLKSLLGAAAPGLHQSLDDIKKQTEVVPPPMKAQEELNRLLKSVSEVVRELKKKGLLAGSKPMWTVPTKNKEKTNEVSTRLLANGRPSDAVQWAGKISSESGVPEQPWGNEGPQGLSNRLANCATAMFDEEEHLKDVGFVAVCGIENGFHTHELEGEKGKRTVSADHIHQGYANSKGGYYGLVGEGLTVPEAYVQFQKTFFPHLTIGKVLAAFLPVNDANWHEALCPDGSGRSRFDYAVDVKNAPEWNPWHKA